MNKRVNFVLSIISSAIILLYLYTFLHEGGHALVAVLNGATITRFVLGMNAHMSFSGGSFTPFSESLRHIGGMLLPVLLLFPTLFAYRREVGSVFYHCFYFILSVGFTGSILAWVVIPVVSMVSTPPPGDDVTKFLASSGIHPLAVTLGAMALIAILVFISLRKGVFQSYFGIARNIRTN